MDDDYDDEDDEDEDDMHQRLSPLHHNAKFPHQPNQFPSSTAAGASVSQNSNSVEN